MNDSTISYSIKVQGRLLSLDSPKVMGILNLTPDSFYGKSRCQSRDEILSHVAEMTAQGMDILDVGACSTRPGGVLVSEKEEMNRLFPALEWIREAYPEKIVSVDTFRSSVARKAAEEYNVDIINDVSAGEADADMMDTVASLQLPYILTHSQEEPAGCDYTVSVCRRLAAGMQALRARGLNDILIDPGFGFAKTLEQNYTLLRHLRELSVLGAPLLVGASRKSMIYKPLNINSEQALNGTTVWHTLALQQGASLLRVHDVREAVECIRIYQLYKQTGL